MAFGQRACVSGSKFSFRISINNCSVIWYYYLGVDFVATPLFADETANMNFYSLAGISAKVIHFTNDFLKTKKKN